MVVLSAEVQHWQTSLLQLQEETERQRALQEQTALEKDSQLASVKEELLSQTQQMDGCQARVSIRFHPHVRHVSATGDSAFQRVSCLLKRWAVSSLLVRSHTWRWRWRPWQSSSTARKCVWMLKMAVWPWAMWTTSRRSTETWSSSSVTRTGSAAFIQAPFTLNHNPALASGGTG